MGVQTVRFVIRRAGEVLRSQTVSAAGIIRIGRARVVEVQLEGEDVCLGHALLMMDECEAKATLASSIISSPVIVDGKPVGACDIFDEGVFEIGSYSIQVFFDPNEHDLIHSEHGYLQACE